MMFYNELIKAVSDPTPTTLWSDIYDRWKNDVNEVKLASSTITLWSKINSFNDFCDFFVDHPDFGLLIFDLRGRPRIIHAIKLFSNNTFHGLTSNRFLSDPIEFDIEPSIFQCSVLSSFETSNYSLSANSFTSFATADEQSATKEAEYKQTTLMTQSFFIVPPIILSTLLQSKQPFEISSLREHLESPMHNIAETNQHDGMTLSSLFKIVSKTIQFMSRDATERIVLHSIPAEKAGKEYVKWIIPKAPIYQPSHNDSNEQSSLRLPNSHSPSPSRTKCITPQLSNTIEEEINFSTIEIPCRTKTPTSSTGQNDQQNNHPRPVPDFVDFRRTLNSSVVIVSTIQKPRPLPTEEFLLSHRLNESPPRKRHKDLSLTSQQFPTPSTANDCILNHQSHVSNTQKPFSYQYASPNSTLSQTPYRPLSPIIPIQEQTSSLPEPTESTYQMMFYSPAFDRFSKLQQEECRWCPPTPLRSSSLKKFEDENYPQEDQTPPTDDSSTINQQQKLPENNPHINTNPLPEWLIPKGKKFGECFLANNLISKAPCLNNIPFCIQFHTTAYCKRGRSCTLNHQDPRDCNSAREFDEFLTRAYRQKVSHTSNRESE